MAAPNLRQQAVLSVLNKAPKPAPGYEPERFPWETTWGKYTFTDEDLKNRVPSSIFKSYKKSISTFQPLDPAVADVIAASLKDWAVERGCTHYCHWFHPIHIATAEKHECFVDLDQSTHKAILVRSESEASRSLFDSISMPDQSKSIQIFVLMLIIPQKSAAIFSRSRFGETSFLCTKTSKSSRADPIGIS